MIMDSHEKSLRNVFEWVYCGSTVYACIGLLKCIFGSDRSPRRGDLVRASVRVCVHHFPQIMRSGSILKSPGGS